MRCMPPSNSLNLHRRLIHRLDFSRILIVSCFFPPKPTESQPGSDGGRLRPYRYVRADRQGGVGLQCHRHRAATLVRHAGVTEASDRAVAHAERSGRRRQKLRTIPPSPRHHRHRRRHRHHPPSPHRVEAARPRPIWIRGPILYCVVLSKLIKNKNTRTYRNPKKKNYDQFY